ncbi:ornithine carbamoyltransferase [Bryobacter aggregatus]|uniref:ornithine carbamoyltransferase n=1 Tax=Bryobacter aggregatus TaxID=360054 RepID=UPI00068CD4A5|nr:ornithine carbamoyltransferase [Bryobacter aggregatus]
MSAALASDSFPKTQTIASGDLTSDLSITGAELRHLLDLATDVKQNPTRYATALRYRYLSLLFEKPSLRTRLTFELAIKQLGGDAVASIGLIGDREPVKDIARNLDRWTNAIVARTFTQQTIEELAEWSSVPVINALSDLYHPCQSFADLQTIEEHFGALAGVKLCFVGDGNNVAHSLLLNGARLGMHVCVACPEGYEPNAQVLAQAAAFAQQSGGAVSVTNEAVDGVRNSQVVYTDVWTSMGQESEAEDRKKTFAPFQVNAGLMSAAAKDSVFLHCLPAKREQEVTDAVIESPQSLVFDQAENRLHAQKALLLMLLA